jgi:hypothetical protein
MRFYTGYASDALLLKFRGMQRLVMAMHLVSPLMPTDRPCLALHLQPSDILTPSLLQTPQGPIPPAKEVQVGGVHDVSRRKTPGSCRYKPGLLLPAEDLSGSWRSNDDFTSFAYFGCISQCRSSPFGTIARPVATTIYLFGPNL